MYFESIFIFEIFSFIVEKFGKNPYLGGSGACLAMQVRLISEPARTNSSGPESISAFDTATNKVKHCIIAI